MNIRILTVLLLGMPAFANISAQERIPSSGNSMQTYGMVSNIVPYSVNDEGKSFKMKWGLDTAWDNETNIRRGIAFIGKENISLARASFNPNYNLTAAGELSSNHVNMLVNRINHIGLIGKHVEILLNDDPGGEDGKVNDMYKTDPNNWARLFDKTVEYIQKKGYTVRSIAPFNEPDYGWGQGTKKDFLNICKAVRNGSFPRLDTIRLCGGNTLNADEALSWYDYLKNYLEEGNTHQLAGSFDNYAKFFTRLKQDGKVATGDELHNIGEAIVGMEYGMTQGIWWGFDGLARGELCRASSGQRLAYTENRDDWTVGAVFRNTLDNKVEAFVGTSERQARPSGYLFVNKDRDVYYDGYGPQRAFVVNTPGGYGYQSGQTNAERVVNITWGEDVQPAPINGTYMIMNMASKCVLAPMGGSVSDGTNIVQVKKNSQNYLSWNIQPIDSAHVGDFSYYTIKHDRSGKSIDVWNWNLNTGAELNLFNGSEGDNELYWFEYAGDGCYFIHSKYSNLVLGTASASVGQRLTTQNKSTKAADRSRQLWRLIPVDAEPELVAPETPSGLCATPQSASVLLHWNANLEDDIAGYTVFRAEDVADGEPVWNTIARNVCSTDFIDNTCRIGQHYLYRIKAVDRAVNSSLPSETVRCFVSVPNSLICQLQFDGNLLDQTPNQFDACHFGLQTYTSEQQTSLFKSGTGALYLDGSNWVQLPYSLAGLSSMTICCWIKQENGNSNNVRLFDFGNGTDQNMYFILNNGVEARLMMKNGDTREFLSCKKVPSAAWKHVAITFSSESIAIYIDAEKVAESKTMRIRPSDLLSALCYIGRGQNPSTPVLKAYIDDFRVYDYPLSPEEVYAVTQDLGTTSGILGCDRKIERSNNSQTTYTYGVNGMLNQSNVPGISINNRKKYLTKHK